jgi:hypothetical protein
MLVAIPEGAVPLVLGTALALTALTLVLSPLLTGEADVRATDDAQDAREAARRRAARARRTRGQDEPLDGAGEEAHPSPSVDGVALGDEAMITPP